MKKSILKKWWFVVICILIAVGTIIILSSTSKVGASGTARLANESKNYEALNIEEDNPSIREDGMRTHGGEGTYEWWYVDAELEDGTTVVNVFYTKDGFDTAGPAHPVSQIDITRPDGSKEVRYIYGEKGKALDASKDQCDVQIGSSSLKYAEGKYYLDYEDELIKYHVVMESTLPMWRPDTGHWYFGEDDKDFFAWFVAQPASNITGTLEIDGKVTEVKGTGYHDHNWGNIPMEDVMNHWYWGRAKVGDYNVIACDIISEKEFGYTRLPVMMIAKDGIILEDDQSKTLITREETYQHEQTGKFMDNIVKFTQKGKNGELYTIVYDRKKDISAINMLDDLPGYQIFLAKLLGENPTYVRVLGDVSLSIQKDGNIEKIHSEGLWEQMFFGSNKDAIIKN